MKKSGTMVPSYAGLLQKVHDLFKEELEGLVLRPYTEVLRDLRGKPPFKGVYLIFDQKGDPLYIGKGDNVRIRLLDHSRIGGDLVQCHLHAEGFDYWPKKAHRCGCGQLIECNSGIEKIEDGREIIAKRIQAKILAEFKVALIAYDHSSKELLPLGLRELERLVQYLIVPVIGKFPHRTKGWISISEHVADHPVPSDIERDLSYPIAVEVDGKEEEKT